MKKPRARTSSTGAVAAPVLEQYTSNAPCPVCAAPVTLFNRRHCKSCGKVVHNECSKTKLILEGTAVRTSVFKRVCDNCATRIKYLSFFPFGLFGGNSISFSSLLRKERASQLLRDKTHEPPLSPIRPERPKSGIVKALLRDMVELKVNEESGAPHARDTLRNMSAVLEQQLSARLHQAASAAAANSGDHANDEQELLSFSEDDVI